MSHINSKLQIWKRNYYSLTLMLSRTGVGWTPSHVIDCTDEQWELIVKTDANAKSMRNKSWPMFAAWQEIFGKDRAIGEQAEDVMDAVNAMMHEDDGAYAGTAYVQVEVDPEDISPTNTDENSVCHDDKGATVDKKGDKGKKRKACEITGLDVAEVLREISSGTNFRLEKIASRIGYEFDLDAAKKDTIASLGSIEGLSLDDKFDLCEIFAHDKERLLIFQGLPEEDRVKYVKRLLQSKHH